MRRFLFSLISALVLCKPLAAAPSVVATIAPVHSLVAAVMGDVGQPSLLLSSGELPHAVTLRPSQARSLTSADLIVWVGEDMERWLVRPLATLGERAETLSLADVHGTRLLPTRQFGYAIGHGDHDHAIGTDPHSWLDPDNAEIWLMAIASTLSELDPQHATDYKANASRAMEDIEAMARDVEAMIAGLSDRRFVMFHDSLQYFERRFDVQAMGSLAGVAAERASVARMTALQTAVGSEGVSCALYEREQGPASFAGLSADRSITLALVDPIGSAIEPGPALYTTMMRQIAEALATCDVD